MAPEWGLLQSLFGGLLHAETWKGHSASFWNQLVCKFLSLLLHYCGWKKPLANYKASSEGPLTRSGPKDGPLGPLNHGMPEFGRLKSAGDSVFGCVSSTGPFRARCVMKVSSRVWKDSLWSRRMRVLNLRVCTAGLLGFGFVAPCVCLHLENGGRGKNRRMLHGAQKAQ